MCFHLDASIFVVFVSKICNRNTSWQTTIGNLEKISFCFTSLAKSNNTCNLFSEDPCFDKFVYDFLLGGMCVSINRTRIRRKDGFWKVENCTARKEKKKKKIQPNKNPHIVRKISTATSGFFWSISLQTWSRFLCKQNLQFLHIISMSSSNAEKSPLWHQTVQSITECSGHIFSISVLTAHHCRRHWNAFGRVDPPVNLPNTTGLNVWSHKEVYKCVLEEQSSCIA